MDRAFSSDVFAIIPAAGSGQRFGAEKPKVFVEVAGIPVIERTVRTIAQTRALKAIVVLCRSEQIESIESLLRPVIPSSVALVVAVGGATRQESVWCGLSVAKMRCGLQPHDLVMVHDAARCLVTGDTIERAVEAARRDGAVTVAMPVVDTISVVSSHPTRGKAPGTLGVLESTPRRSTLVSIQTPQVFQAELLIRAHDFAAKDLQPLSATDDATLVSRLAAVTILEGEAENVKITRPVDVAVAETILSSR